MKKIKFRAWDSYQNKMYEWDEICKMDSEGHITLSNLLNNLIKHIKPIQFTGLKDKNKKDIYKGDILKDNQGELLEVKFGKLPLHKSGDCVCTYQAFYCKCYGKLGCSPMYDCCEIGDWMEVIGNIHENPNLLK